MYLKMQQRTSHNSKTRKIHTYIKNNLLLFGRLILMYSEQMATTTVINTSFKVVKLISACYLIILVLRHCMSLALGLLSGEYEIFPEHFKGGREGPDLHIFSTCNFCCPKCFDAQGLDWCMEYQCDLST